jgi:hypothetical protein
MVRSSVVIGLFAAASVASADPVVFNAASDFSSTSNPNGVWSFGQRAVGYGAFSAFAAHGSYNGVDGWAGSYSGNANFSLPGAFHNGSGSAIPNWVGTVNMPVNALNLHPGADGTLSVARFTVPVGGTYSFSAIFTALARDGTTPPGYSTTTDVHLYQNGTELFGSNFNPPLGGTLSSGTFSASLNANDIIEVAVGRGTNNYYSDSTGVDFTVTQTSIVPLPAAAYAGIGTLAGVAMMGVARRRRAASI